MARNRVGRVSNSPHLRLLGAFYAPYLYGASRSLPATCAHGAQPSLGTEVSPDPGYCHLLQKWPTAKGLCS